MQFDWTGRRRLVISGRHLDYTQMFAWWNVWQRSKCAEMIEHYICLKRCTITILTFLSLQLKQIVKYLLKKQVCESALPVCHCQKIHRYGSRETEALHEGQVSLKKQHNVHNEFSNIESDSQLHILNIKIHSKTFGQWMNEWIETTMRRPTLYDGDSAEIDVSWISP